MIRMFMSPKNPMMGSTMILTGIFLIVVALAIIAAPELLAYIVATVLMFFGIAVLTFGLAMRSAGKKAQKMFIDS